MTVNEFIFQLELLRHDLRNLPIVIIAPNGLEMEPKVKIKIGEDEKVPILAKAKTMVITFDEFA